jgi:PRC-barrel domain
MFKHTLTAAALAVALATSAFAQQQPTAKHDTVDQSSMPSQTTGSHSVFVQTQRSTDWRGSKLIGATVYGPENASIGNVNDVLVANDGKINAVVIGVGGFLGVGEKDVAVSFDSLNITRMPNSNSIDKITVSYSKDELKNAPKFAFYEPAKLQTTGSSVTDKIKSLNPMNDDWKK